MTKTTTWIGKAAILTIGLAAGAALMLAALSDPAEAKKKHRNHAYYPPPGGAASAFLLNVENAVSAISSLVGEVDGPLLHLDNNGAGANSTGLDIQVEPGKAPITVNPEAGKAINLDSDKLDGQDSIAFLTSKIYQKPGDTVQGNGNLTSAKATCDAGDIALSGGYTIAGSNANILVESTFGDTYTVGFDDANAVQPNVTCADFPPLRAENAGQSTPNQENAESSDPKQDKAEQSNPKQQNT